MANIYYDEFSRLPKQKMAKAISDMTYLYQDTHVPKKHYETHLSKSIEEVLEANTQINLINTYFSMLKELKEQNSKWFFQALLCLDTKTNPVNISQIEYEAMEKTWNKFQDEKRKTLLDIDVLAYFQKTKKEGTNE